MYPESQSWTKGGGVAVARPHTGGSRHVGIGGADGQPGGPGGGGLRGG
ncbi:hypothetical protein ACFFX0_02945 [Citricoccus parietis]|uniref:Uncharacterized protein n=1 Tax=Citricoccus parietis TaxID=592307 RepID=A0ABV5FU58_9MICC